ncbi:3-oxoadipate enol-lactonase [Rhodobaculum claviforme]|uniref:3-oxoadipate enol-lactonase n=1 Tax=Rhodobaculum claviforme TaxID=1549854 RepID=A0A934TLK1_9RHOB|nr:3-oxoadipate enol-lactonase [Rhodobaculum claviforme]MBK5927756.1 3-oxoadipate enol-lactonase [Rhodobaculum claviforme]
MRMIDTGGTQLHMAEDGTGRPVVFLHALGTDLRLWTHILPRLPAGLRLIRCDLRGHGLSDCPPPPYGMGALVRDIEGLLERLEVTGSVVVGCSLGGMIAQGLAIKRPDLVGALVLSNTAARIGTAQAWHDRIATLHAGGIKALSEATLARWFPPAFRATPDAALWRHMLERTPPDGYAGCAAAIAGTDFHGPIQDLRLPVLGIAGSEDGSTPPDLVRETVALIPGAEFALIRGAGHLPMADRPDAFAATLAEFLAQLP